MTRIEKSKFDKNERATYRKIASTFEQKKFFGKNKISEKSSYEPGSASTNCMNRDRPPRIFQGQNGTGLGKVFDFFFFSNFFFSSKIFFFNFLMNFSYRFLSQLFLPVPTQP